MTSLRKTSRCLSHMYISKQPQRNWSNITHLFQRLCVFCGKPYLHAQETGVREQAMNDNSAPPGLGKNQTSRQQGVRLWYDKPCHFMQSLDMEHIKHIYNRSKDASEASTNAHITPLQPGDVKRIDDVSDGEEMRWIRTGFKLIAEVRKRQLSLPSSAQRALSPARRSQRPHEASAIG